MIVAAFLALLIVAGAVCHALDERLMRTSWYPRFTERVLGPADDEPVAPVLPISHVRAITPDQEPRR